VSEPGTDLPPAEQRPRTPRAPLVALIAGAALLVLGPFAGIATTAFFVQRAFGAVADADPSEKARLLASGISDAMNFSVFGFVVGALGFVVGAVGAVALLGKRRT